MERQLRVVVRFILWKWWTDFVLRYFQVKDRNHLESPCSSLQLDLCLMVLQGHELQKDSKISLMCSAQSMAFPQMAYFDSFSLNPDQHTASKKHSDVSQLWLPSPDLIYFSFSLHHAIMSRFSHARFGDTSCNYICILFMCLSLVLFKSSCFYYLIFIYCDALQLWDERGGWELSWLSLSDIYHFLLWT